MATPGLPSVDSLSNLDEVKGYLHKLDRRLRFLLEGGLDTKNIREIGGWSLSEDSFESVTGWVGMSSAETGANDLRIWAGSTIREASPFRVYEDGAMYSSNGFFSGEITASSFVGGTITGALIRTAVSGGRMEMDTSAFRVYRPTGSKAIEINPIAVTSDSPALKFFDGLGNTAGYMWTAGGYMFEIAGPGSSGFIDMFSTGELRLVGNPIVLWGGSGPDVRIYHGIGGYYTMVLHSGSTFFVSSVSDHNHGIPPGTKLATTTDGSTVSGAVTFVASGGHDHVVWSNG